MKVHVAGQQYTLTDRSIAAVMTSIEQFAIDQYDKLPDTAKLAGMAAVRALLAYAEKAENDVTKKKEIRPPKGTDPTIHLIRLLLKGIAGVLPHVECEISTDGEYISNFSFQYTSQGRGSLPIDGDIRERQDHSRETLGPEVS